jgi:hypothetical protein
MEIRLCKIGMLSWSIGSYRWFACLWVLVGFMVDDERIDGIESNFPNFLSKVVPGEACSNVALSLMTTVCSKFKLFSFGLDSGLLILCWLDRLVS